jgi:hypothetical protein
MIAVVGAVATAAATALISPSTWGSVWDAVSGDESSSPPTSQSPSPSQSLPTSADTPTPLKSVQSNEGGVIMRVPQDWGSREAAWNLTFVPSPRPGVNPGRVDVGDGLLAGIGTGAVNNSYYDSESFVVVASSAAAERLDMPGRSESELVGYLFTLVRSAHYDLDDCTLVAESEVDVPGYFEVAREYETCRGFPGSHYWDVQAVSVDGRVMVSAGLASTKMSLSEQQEMLSDWTVAPEKLPTGPAYKRDDAAEDPPPPWLPQGELPGDSAGLG